MKILIQTMVLLAALMTVASCSNSSSSSTKAAAPTTLAPTADATGTLSTTIPVGKAVTFSAASLTGATNSPIAKNFAMTIPANALSKPVDVKVFETGSLALQVNAPTSFGLATMTGAGPAMVVSGDSTAIIGKVTITVPYTATASLDLDATSNTFAVISLNGTTLEIFTGSQITVGTTGISFQTAHFGAFQAVAITGTATQATATVSISTDSLQTVQAIAAATAASTSTSTGTTSTSTACTVTGISCTAQLLAGQAATITDAAISGFQLNVPAGAISKDTSITISAITIYADSVEIAGDSTAIVAPLSVTIPVEAGILFKTPQVLAGRCANTYTDQTTCNQDSGCNWNSTGSICIEIGTQSANPVVGVITKKSDGTGTDTTIAATSGANSTFNFTTSQFAIYQPESQYGSFQTSTTTIAVSMMNQATTANVSVWCESGATTNADGSVTCTSPNPNYCTGILTVSSDGNTSCAGS